MQLVAEMSCDRHGTGPARVPVLAVAALAAHAMPPGGFDQLDGLTYLDSGAR
jgi:hypothetical protein